MKWRDPLAYVCLGIAVAAQGCVDFLGFDETREFGVPCTTPTDCPGVDNACSARACVSGTCAIDYAPAGQPCEQTNFCNGSGLCKLGPGLGCFMNSQCFSGFCADSVCCDEACDGTCEACDLADSKGVCTPLPPKTGRGAECTNGECNGVGACIHDLGQVCSDGTNCISTFCADGVCCDTVCDGICVACDLPDFIGACSPMPINTGRDKECTDGACNGAGSCIYDDGKTCSDETSCISSFCVAGLCCPTGCSIGASCEMGMCQCPGVNPLACDNVCKDGSRDSENCNMCGNACDLTKNVGCVDSKCEDLTWALWPMPHTPGTGLPEINYEIDEAQGTVYDKVTRLMWQREATLTNFSWQNAIAHCKNLVLAGFDDWRLPTRIELVSIVDYTKLGPTIDEAAFPLTPQQPFWTSSPSVSSVYAWSVNFFHGKVKDFTMGGNFHVRCVR